MKIEDHKVHRGTDSAVKYFKAIYLISKKIAMNDYNFTPIPWTKSCREGIPSVIRPMLPFLQGDNECKRVALTILRSYEIITVAPKLDTSAITNPNPNPIPQEFHEGFKAFTKI